MPDQAPPPRGVRVANGRHCAAWVLSVVVALLVGLGLIDPGPGLLAAMIALPMFAAMIAFVALTARYASPTAHQNWRATRVAACAAGVTAIVVSALGGLTDLAGDATFPVLVVVAFVTAPWAWSTVRPHVGRLEPLRVMSRRASADPDRARRDDPAT